MRAYRHGRAHSFDPVPLPAPSLRCPICERQVVLPTREIPGGDPPEAYWPGKDQPLQWVCDACRHCTTFHSQDIQWTPETLPVAADRGFWRVEIPCADPACPANITAYTQTFGMTSRRALGAQIASAQPTPWCFYGHEPAANPYPVQLDFVEWTGDQPYLV